MKMYLNIVKQHVALRPYPMKKCALWFDTQNWGLPGRDMEHIRMKLFELGLIKFDVSGFMQPSAYALQAYRQGVQGNYRPYVDADGFFC